MPRKNVAAVTIEANTAGLPGGLRQASGMLSAWSSNAMKMLSSVHLAPKENAKRWWVGHAAGTTVSHFTNRGIDSIIDQGREIFKFEERLMRFGVVAHMSGNQLRGVGTSIRRISDETGLSALALLEGAEAYAGVAGASAFSIPKIELLARTAQAAETDIKTLSQVMFQLQHSMKVDDAGLESAMGGIIETSKEGAVHFKDMAHEIAELAPQAARYKLVGREGVNKLTALMQVARTGFGSVSEMGTGITRVFAGLTMHAKKFEAYGVRIFDKNPKTGMKTWRHFSDIFRDISKNKILSRDPNLLRAAFGRSEADRTIRLWLEGVDKLKQFEKAGDAEGVIGRDLRKVLSSDPGKLALAFERMKNAAAEAFTPERINAFVDAVGRLGEKIGPVVEGVGKIGDALGWVYDKGKDLRGTLDSDAEPLFDMERQFALEKSGKFKTREEAVRAASAEFESYKKLFYGVKNSLNNDQPTEASDMLVAAALMDHEGGTMAGNAARSYALETKMNPTRTREMQRLIRQRRDVELAESGGFAAGYMKELNPQFTPHRAPTWMFDREEGIGTGRGPVTSDELRQLIQTVLIPGLRSIGNMGRTFGPPQPPQPPQPGGWGGYYDVVNGPYSRRGT